MDRGKKRFSRLRWNEMDWTSKVTFNLLGSPDPKEWPSCTLYPFNQGKGNVLQYIKSYYSLTNTSWLLIKLRQSYLSKKRQGTVKPRRIEYHLCRSFQWIIHIPDSIRTFIVYGKRGYRKKWKRIWMLKRWRNWIFSFLNGYSEIRSVNYNKPQTHSFYHNLPI